MSCTSNGCCFKQNYLLNPFISHRPDELNLFDCGVIWRDINVEQQSYSQLKICCIMVNCRFVVKLVTHTMTLISRNFKMYVQDHNLPEKLIPSNILTEQAVRHYTIQYM